MDVVALSGVIRDAAGQEEALVVNEHVKSMPGPGLGQHVWLAGLLGNAHDAAVAIVNFRTGSVQAEFFNSPTLSLAGLTALTTLRQSIQALPPEIRRELGGQDWAAWQALGELLPPVNEAQREQLWEAMAALAPSLMTSLRRLRRNRPELFNPLGSAG